MRLQRLEIAGFKSFSDRSELAFDEGVTAIVGPNGCGKSNVADAITWVLGEQSAKSLRGDRMEDVIFSGSDARKPTGSAEVRLLLANVTSVPASSRSGSGEEADALVQANGNGMRTGTATATATVPTATATDTACPRDRNVEVIRRLYRSGESEYLIDGQICRLRDVHELLMDTGLGAKAYAIIEQGKIGLILSSRPADRRQLIEEAAGITKYKSRRRAAELKLDAAQQNLTRVDDIVFEVEKQRGTLKRQAAKARRYRRLRDELRRWEKVLFAGRYRELSSSLDGTRARLGQVREREAVAAARVAELEGALGRVRIELAEAEARATAARERAHACELETQRREQQIELHRQQVAALESRTAEMDGEIALLETRREPGRIQIDERRQACAQAEADAAGGGRHPRGRAGGPPGGAPRSRGARWRRRGGAQRGVRRHQRGDGAAPRHPERRELAVSACRRRSGRSKWKRAISASSVKRSRPRGSAPSNGFTKRRPPTSVPAACGRRTKRLWRPPVRSTRALARELRAREHDLAGLTARLRSLEELEAERAGYGDAARVVLAQANGAVGQLGAIADYLDVDRRLRARRRSPARRPAAARHRAQPRPRAGRPAPRARA